MDDGGIIKVPNGHVWIEVENGKVRDHDSLSSYGPLSKKYIQGQALFTIWPIWRWTSFRSLEKYKVITL